MPHAVQRCSKGVACSGGPCRGGAQLHRLPIDASGGAPSVSPNASLPAAPLRHSSPPATLVGQLLQQQQVGGVCA